MKKYRCDFVDDDGRRCKNAPYREVYQKRGWAYLCRRHFDSEKRRRPRPFFAWCAP